MFSARGASSRGWVRPKFGHISRLCAHVLLAYLQGRFCNIPRLANMQREQHTLLAEWLCLTL